MSNLAINTILFCVFIHLSWQNGFLLIYGKKNRQGLGEACAGSGAANFLSVNNVTKRKLNEVNLQAQKL